MKSSIAHLSSLSYSYNDFCRYTAGQLPNAFAHNRYALLLTGMWSLIILVFILGYVGTLISFLSVVKLKPIIFKLEDLPTSGLVWVGHIASVG